jgi:hypothetical protein
MYATNVADAINNFNAGDWQQIPFRVNLKAEDTEYEDIFGGGSGGNQLIAPDDDATATLDSDGKLQVAAGNNNVSIEAYSDSGDGYSTAITPDGIIGVWNGAETWSTGMGPAGATITAAAGKSMAIAADDQEKSWVFNPDGSITFPDNTVQTTAYTGQSGDTSVSYKGFKATYGRMYDSEPTISKVLIYQDTATPSSDIDTDTSSDLFQVSGLANSDVVALLNIYGDDTTHPTAFSTLQHFVKSIVDTVILNGGQEGNVNTVENMKINFYDLFDNFASRSGERYKNFKFTREEWLGIPGSNGSGTGATFDLFRNRWDDTINNIDYNQAGINYQVNDVVTVLGTALGGTSPANDIVITVTGVGAGGQIENYSYTGTLPNNLFPLDNIEDGGSDQYDGANYIYTNIQGNSRADPDVDNGEWALDYNSGNPAAGDPWFGADSDYVVTYNDSIFGLFVTGANINWIATDGNSGFDGDGIADTGSLDMSNTDGLTNGDQIFTLNSNGTVTFPDGTVQTTAYTEGDGNVWVQNFETMAGAPADIVAIANSVEYLDNGDIVALFSHLNDTSYFGGNRYNSIARFTPAGEKVWSMSFTGALATDGWGLAVDSNSIYVAGVKNTGEFLYDVATLTKLAQSDGEILWSKTYDVGYNNTNLVVDVGYDNNPVVVGYANNGTDSQLITTKIDSSNGSVIWSRALNGQGNEDAYGMAVGRNNNNEVVTVGYMDEIVEQATYPVTPLTGSATDVLIINRSELGSNTLNTSWLVAGTGITGTASISQINIYNALTGTVQQGTGATFNIIDNGNGTYSAGIETGGTNYLPGHKIKILGTDLGGNTPDNDIVITVQSVTGSGIIDGVGNAGTAPTTSYSSSFDYSEGGLIVTEVGSSILIVNVNLWSALTTNMLALPSGTVMNIEYIGTDDYQLTLTSGFVYDEGRDRYEATFTSLTPNVPTPLDGFVTAISYGVSTPYNGLSGTNYQTGSGLSFDFVSDSNNTYTEHTTNIFAGGTNYVNGDVVVIPGTQLGGTSPANDLTAVVSATDGAVTTFNSFSGAQQTTTYRISVIESVDFSGVGTWTLIGNATDSVDRMLVVKYDSSGTIAWQKAIQVDAGYNCKGADADIDNNGNVYVCGNFDYDNNGDTNSAMIIIKFNFQGVKKWTRKVQGPCEDFASSIVVGPDDCLYLSAFTADAPAGPNTDYSMVVAKYNLDGTVAWQRVLDSISGSTTAGGSLFGPSNSGSTIAVRLGYVAVSGAFSGTFFDTSAVKAIVAQFDTDGKTFTVGDYDFKAATFSGLLNPTASNITVVNAGKTDSNYAGEFTVGNFAPTFNLASNLLGTVYRSINPGNELRNGNYFATLNANGSITLPAGGKISEAVVTSNPTIQLTPARPDVASQKLVIKGGGTYYFYDNNIDINYYSNILNVNDTLTIYVNSSTYASQTLYWWIYPEGVGVLDSDFGSLALNSNGSGQFTIQLDSDDYEFRVRVSPENNNYDPASIGVQSGLINADAPAFDADHHLHLTTGNLSETSILLGTDNHNVRTTTDGGIQVTTQTTTVELPFTITITGADVAAVNLVYTRDLTEITPTWTSPEINQATDPYIVWSEADGEWGIIAPDYDPVTPLYVNTGTLAVPLAQWSTNPPLGSIPPLGVYTYLTPDVHAWQFGIDGSLTVPGIITKDIGLQLVSSGTTYGSSVNIYGDLGRVLVRTDNGTSNKDWQFNVDGTLTFPDNTVQTTAYVANTLTTVAKDGPVFADIGKGEAATVTVSPTNNTNLTPGTVTGIVFGTGFTLDITVAVNGDISAVVTDSISNLSVGDFGTLVGGSPYFGGTEGTDNITFTVATLTNIIAATAIDLTKSVNKLTDGAYSLADGVDGQIMYLVRQTGSSKDAISINVANARIDGILNTTIAYYPFENITDLNMSTLIFTDGAWQASNGGWD